MEDDLDQEDDQEQHEAPASFGVVVLEDGADAAALPPHLLRQFRLNLGIEFCHL